MNSKFILTSKKKIFLVGILTFLNSSLWRIMECAAAINKKSSSVTYFLFSVNIPTTIVLFIRTMPDLITKSDS